jgi:pSer/pThr/pTyr-binding forkhead associated (FHA) protein
MSWDKRATVRRVSDPPPKRSAGVYLVYLGLTENAARRDEPLPASLQVGDVFRLLPGKAITIGRSRLCEVTVDAVSVSSAHALLSFMPDPETRIALIDLDSRTGTKVEGRRAPVHYLEAGGEFVVADAYRFRCQPAG